MSSTSLTIRSAEGAAALGTVLGVWAHPDDESFLSAGLMALARRAGNTVVCVGATRGEHGTDDVTRWPPDRLARTRELEVRAAMAVLGVDDHRCLGLEDGTLGALDHRAGAAAVARVIDEVRPDTLITFGPDGMTGHPDHRAVSRWVTDAWWQTGGHGRLLYATTTASFADEFADLHESLPIYGPGLPLRTAERDVALHVALGSELLDVKLAALRAQATQIEQLVRSMGEDTFARWVRDERFTDARTVMGRPARSREALDVVGSGGAGEWLARGVEPASV